MFDDDGCIFKVGHSLTLQWRFYGLMKVQWPGVRNTKIEDSEDRTGCRGKRITGERRLGGKSCIRECFHIITVRLIFPAKISYVSVHHLRYWYTSVGKIIIIPSKLCV